MHELNFTDHRRQLLENRYIYAVISRRAGGLSIGINLNPDKTCNFDCPYCQVDRRIKGGDRHVSLEILKRELEHILSLFKDGGLWQIEPFLTAKLEHRRLIDISFSGDGEPTICPEFVEAVGAVMEIKKFYHLDTVQINLFSNSTMFQKEKVRIGLKLLWSGGGCIWAKLDAGTAEWYQRVDASNVPFHRVLENIEWAARQKPIVLQCMFHRFGEEKPSAEEIQAWASRIDHIFATGGQISWIQVYTTARVPSQADVLPLLKEDLEVIAEVAEIVVKKWGENTKISVSG
jgi:wyosine [tRNA(Phe)-imidazoG37] synthetase (radical SAM superfamily)